MSSWYSGVDPVKNTDVNRAALLARITIDPDLVQYAVTSVNRVDDYTIVVIFANTLTDSTDSNILQTSIDIIFNAATPNTLVPRRVVSTSANPIATNDLYSNFVVGSAWINTSYNRKYECINNTVGAAVWRVVPFVELNGAGTGPIGPESRPYEGSVLQYNTTSKLWTTQPGKYRVASADLVLSGSNVPTVTSGKYMFSNAGGQELFGSLVIPTDYAEGTDITFNVGYQTSSGNPGTVDWDLTYTWADPDSVFPTAATISSSSDSTSTAYKHIRSSFASVTGSSKHILSVISFNITRLATGTYPGDVALLYCNISYQTTGTGSTQPYAK